MREVRRRIAGLKDFQKNLITNVKQFKKSKKRAEELIEDHQVFDAKIKTEEAKNAEALDKYLISAVRDLPASGQWVAPKHHKDNSTRNNSVFGGKKESI